MPVYYQGVMWCIRVPTGAFVARRNGKVFVTGNSGFPKSHDISKALDKEAVAEREVVGAVRKSIASMGSGQGNFSDDGYQWKAEFPITAPATPLAKQWAGYGSALKPSYEPVTVAMKPMPGTYAQNARQWGVAGLNIDGCRVESGEWPCVEADRGRITGNSWCGGLDGSLCGSKANGTTTQGRWPPNLILDGSPEAQAGMPQAGGGYGKRGAGGSTYGSNRTFRGDMREVGYGDAGSAARFFPCCPITAEDYRYFYCAKASKSERNHNGQVTNKHPTVKPLSLMKWLLTIVTMPTENYILDPFAGSGSTLVAAKQLGLPYLGIELSPDYHQLCLDRLAATTAPATLF